MLAIVYLIFFGIGLEKILDHAQLKNMRWQKGMFVVLGFVFAMFGNLLLGGFQKQLTAVHYPQSWYEVRKIVQKNDSDKKVLLLPWHGYFSLQFNNNLVTANPGRVFFGKQTIISRNAEIGNVMHDNPDSDYSALDLAITNSGNIEIEKITSLLASQNIGYVILLRDIEKQDALSYSFLQQPEFSLLLDTPQIRVYRFSSLL